MSTNEPPPLDEPGLAGGPGPTPPGFEDNTPKANSGPGAGPGAVPRDPAAEKQEGEADEAERSDPEEPDSA